MLMPHLRLSPLTSTSLDAVHQSDATDQRAEREVIVEEIGVLVDQGLVVAYCRVDAQLPPIRGRPRTILHVLDPGDDQTGPGLTDSEDLQGLG